MGYYRGDYYRGDYYRGDIFGFLGKAIGGVAKAVGTIVPGPIGAIAKLAGNALGPKASVPAVMNAGNFPVMQSYAPPQAAHPVQLGPIRFGQPVFPPDYDNYGTDTAGAPPGRRPGDTGRVGHFKKDGTWTNRARPRMNVTNVRALRKAGRRVRGFLKLAGKLGALPVSRSPKGKLFKRKKR